MRYQELDAAYHTLLSGPWLPRLRGGVQASLQRGARLPLEQRARRQRVIEAGYLVDQHIRYQAEHPVRCGRAPRRPRECGKVGVSVPARQSRHRAVR